MKASTVTLDLTLEAARAIAGVRMFQDDPSVAQIKRAILSTPVVFVQEQQSLRSTRNPDQVWPPDYAIFEEDRFHDHSCNREQFMVKLGDKLEEVEKRCGKKPFVIVKRI